MLYNSRMLLDWLFPETCLSCKKSGSALCSDCFSKLRSADPVEDDWITPLYSYRDPIVHQALFDIKFYGKFRVADCFGESLADAALSHLTESVMTTATEVLIVPIPASHTGRLRRGYNQATAIAEALKKNIAVPARFDAHALTKTKKTERQATIKERGKRLSNMNGAFAARKDTVENQVIILVDDITTTGATLRDARRALQKAGAKKVFAVTIAH